MDTHALDRVRGILEEQERLWAIPGVPEAIAFHQAMLERGRYEGWHQLPEALAAVEVRKLMTTPVDWTLDNALV